MNHQELRENKGARLSVRLLDGQSAVRELWLDGDQPLAPMTIGTRGAWRVAGAHVAEEHVALTWSGTRLFACAIGPFGAALDGAPLEARWRELRVGSELRFGSVRLLVATPRATSPEKNQEREVLLDEATRIADDGYRAQIDAVKSTEPLAPPLRAPVVGPPRGPSTKPLARPLSIAARSSMAVTFPLAPPLSPAVATSDDLVSALAQSTPAPMHEGPVPFDVAPSSPSSPTIACALPMLPPVEAAAPRGPESSEQEDPVRTMAVTAEHPAAPDEGPRAFPRALADLARRARSLSGPRKAIAVLTVPMLFVGILAMRDGNKVALAHAREAPANGAPALVMPASSVAAPSRAVGGTPFDAPRVPRASAGTPTGPASLDLRTAERRALDAAASGSFASAAEQYDALAIARPDNPAFREAARILRQRASR